MFDILNVINKYQLIDEMKMIMKHKVDYVALLALRRGALWWISLTTERILPLNNSLHTL